MLFLFILFVICVGGCYVVFKAIGDAVFGKGENQNTYIDKSVHHHYYDNRSVNIDGESFKKLGK